MTAAELAYDRKLRSARARSLEQVAAAQDIGPIPPVADPRRREAAERSLRVFCEVYFAKRFYLGWSRDHLKVIAQIEDAARFGGLFALAMPRGSGKTSICEVACPWVAFTGLHRSLLLVGNTDPKAVQNLRNVRMMFEFNKLLQADFPEILYPFRCLNGESRKQQGQKHFGRRTGIRIEDSEIRLPDIPGSAASGTWIRAAGLIGDLRGSLDAMPDGSTERPTFCIIDDPQTKASARSPLQVKERESIIAGDILGLAPPNREMTAIMPCTVIRRDDLADRMLNRDLHPEWRGVRMRYVNRWPTGKRAEDFWNKEYRELRENSFRAGGKGEEATALYARKRRIADHGAEVAWEERFPPGCISALQNAYNLRFRDEVEFQSEYQNEPVVDEETSSPLMTADEIAAKTNGRKRGVVPGGCSRVTAFIDVQGKLLYWTVVAWEEDFTGYVIDYGSWPDQGEHYFTLRGARRTIAAAHPGMPAKSAAYKALEELAQRLLGRTWPTDDGNSIRISRCLIDSGWGDSTQLVYAFCAQSVWANALTPYKGEGIGAKQRPMSAFRVTKGDRVGLHWRLPKPNGKRAVRVIFADTNFWKSHVFDGFSVPLGGQGCISLFGHRADAHRMFAEQLTAEKRVEVKASGRTVGEWSLVSTHRDNHFLDCMSGAAIAASLEGVRPGAVPDDRVRPSAPVILSNIPRRRFAE